MRENKTGKYLKYAIGEIVLVVIGILIALQINNWNESRIEAIQEKVTLSNLNDEFQDNLTNLDSVSIRLSSTMAAMESLYAMFSEEENPYSSKTLDSLIGKVFTSPNWKPSEFVLNDLKNSDGLSKLNNKELKRLLFQWSRFDNQMKEIVMQTEKTSLDIIKFVKDHGSLRNADVSNDSFPYGRSELNIDNLPLLQNPQFENYIGDKLFVLHEAQSMSIRAKQLINQILLETSVD